MTNKQLVAPRTGTTDYPGACLRFTQSFFGAPVQHRSAWHAWLALPEKFGPQVPVPTDVAVILWYSHWGTYNDGRGQYGDDPNNPYYGNWGHVTPIVPGQGIYSSPAYQKYDSAGRPIPSQDIYSSTTQIDSIFGASYVGWSYSINGLRVAEPATPSGKDFIMPALIQNYDKSIGFVSDSGMLDAISTMREVDSLKMTGLVGDIVPFKDGTVWNALAARTARLKAQQGQVDTKKLAAEIAALMVGPVVAALSQSGQLTQTDVEEAVAKVTKEMLAKAAA